MRLERLFVSAVLFLFMLTGLSLSAHAQYPEHIVGAGIGLPYGGDFGVNYELGLNEFVAPTIGIGWLPDNIGWNLGVRAYYPGRDYYVRGRFTLLYGTNSDHERISASGSDHKTNSGFSAGVGVDWELTDHWGVCADMFIADIDTPAGYNKNDDDFFLALGFYYRW
jgi:opacity protein-like surface antigen